jgi:hypothetical protein
MSFNDLLKQSASIMEAYKKMKESSCEKEIEESDDTGGDGSAYNKYLLATTGDLPKTKEEYMKVDEAKKNPCWDGYEKVGTKQKNGKEVPNCVPVEESNSKFHSDVEYQHKHKFVTGHKPSFDKVEHSPIEKPEDKKKMSDEVHIKKLDESDDVDSRYEKWRSDVQAAHPDKKLTFKYRSERKSVVPTTHTTAEVANDPEKRAYGMWDHDKDEGHVFGINEEKMTDAQMKRREELVMGMKKNMADFQKKYGDRAKEVIYATATKQALSESCCDHNKSSYTFGSVKFNTYAFPTKDEANTFMQTPQGQQYGFIGMDDKGQFHVAHMDDNGETLA